MEEIIKNLVLNGVGSIQMFSDNYSTYEENSIFGPLQHIKDAVKDMNPGVNFSVLESKEAALNDSDTVKVLINLAPNELSNSLETFENGQKIIYCFGNGLNLCFYSILKDHEFSYEIRYVHIATVYG